MSESNWALKLADAFNTFRLRMLLISADHILSELDPEQAAIIRTRAANDVEKLYSLAVFFRDCVRVGPPDAETRRKVARTLPS